MLVRRNANYNQPYLHNKCHIRPQRAMIKNWYSFSLSIQNLHATSGQ